MDHFTLLCKEAAKRSDDKEKSKTVKRKLGKKSPKAKRRLLDLPDQAGQNWSAEGTQSNPSVSTTQEVSCLVCGEEFCEPIVEDWIRCASCTLWAYENCTPYEGVGLFYCSECKNKN